MRKQLEYLQDQLQRMEPGHVVGAIEDLRQVMYQVLELLDVALPKEVEPD